MAEGEDSGKDSDPAKNSTDGGWENSESPADSTEVGDGHGSTADGGPSQFETEAGELGDETTGLEDDVHDI
ncbi:hypothetical protein CVT25_014907 [Psilocybe cyanescens]|uniref:Uncharacterized protein n=1 Tax=Psilocybe cyanescens TaxID=93625 RepID=A0A409WEZ9_PSICY|nr:hypothetical protein CVT25_014907 [Psilocybe cyanescens]